MTLSIKDVRQEREALPDIYKAPDFKQRATSDWISIQAEIKLASTEHHFRHQGTPKLQQMDQQPLDRDTPAGL